MSSISLAGIGVPIPFEPTNATAPGFLKTAFLLSGVQSIRTKEIAREERFLNDLLPIAPARDSIQERKKTCETVTFQFPQ
jgi:hypothetical protein